VVGAVITDASLDMVKSGDARHLEVNLSPVVTPAKAPVVVPAKAGIQEPPMERQPWIPALRFAPAGMTERIVPPRFPEAFAGTAPIK